MRTKRRRPPRSTILVPPKVLIHLIHQPCIRKLNPNRLGSNTAAPPHRAIDGFPVRYERCYKSRGGDQIPYAQFRGYGTPPETLGSPGDIFLDITDGAYRAFAKTPHWIEWAGIKQCRQGQTVLRSTHPQVYHPYNDKMVLWCTTKDVVWYRRALVKKARMRVFRRTGKGVVSVREMVEGMKVLKKEIKAISEGSDGRGCPRRSPDGSTNSHTPRMELEVDTKYALRSAIRGPSPRDPSLRRDSRFSPLAPSRRYNVAAESSIHFRRTDAPTSDIEDDSDLHDSDLPDGVISGIRKREEELTQRELQENQQLAELVEQYRECAVKIGAAKKEAKQAKELLREASVVDLERLEEESIRRNQEIERFKELVLQQDHELERSRGRLRKIEGELSRLEEYGT